MLIENIKIYLNLIDLELLSGSEIQIQTEIIF